MPKRVNKIIAANFPNLEKQMPTQIREASSTPNRQDQNRTSPWHIIIKEQTSTQRVALNHLHTLKSLNNKTSKWQEVPHISQYYHWML
jgi:hypothetical protein